MREKIHGFLLITLVGFVLTTSSCSGERLLFDDSSLGCTKYCPVAWITTSFDELYDQSDYVYKIKIKSFKGYANSAYQCCRWDCWSFKILSTYKEDKKKTTEFFIQHRDYGDLYPEIITGQEYYIFLRDLTGYNEYVHDGFVTFTEDMNDRCFFAVD